MTSNKFFSGLEYNACNAFPQYYKMDLTCV